MFFVKKINILKSNFLNKLYFKNRLFFCCKNIISMSKRIVVEYNFNIKVVYKVTFKFN